MYHFLWHSVMMKEECKKKRQTVLSLILHKKQISRERGFLSLESQSIELMFTSSWALNQIKTLEEETFPSKSFWQRASSCAHLNQETMKCKQQLHKSATIFKKQTEMTQKVQNDGQLFKNIQVRSFPRLFYPRYYFKKWNFQRAIKKKAVENIHLL